MDVTESFTFNTAVAVLPPYVAVILDAPLVTPVAIPPDAIVATVALLLLQVALLVTLAVVPSAYVAVAVNCCVPPMSTLALEGVTAIELTALFSVTHS